MSQSGPSIPAAMQKKYDAIAALIEPFCRERLNEEYLGLCVKMLAMLARKRPSPLVNGTVAAWACGIVRAVGWVNFLDDPTQTPHMKMTAIDTAMGVSSGTGAGKSKTIRDLFKIHAFATEWTLPGKMNQNPMAWMIQVNGMIVDARQMPKEVQEEAVQRGLVPPIPGIEQDIDSE